MEYDTAFQDFKLKVNELIAEGSTVGVNEYKILITNFVETVEDLVISVVKTALKRGFEEFCRLEEEMLQRNKNALKLHATYTLPHQQSNLKEKETRLHEQLEEINRQVFDTEEASDRYDSAKLRNLAKNYMEYLAQKYEFTLTSLEYEGVTLLDQATT